VLSLLAAQLIAGFLLGAFRGFQYYMEYHRAMPRAELSRLATDPLLLALSTLLAIPIVGAALFVMVRLQRGGPMRTFLALRGFSAKQFFLWLAVLAAVLIGGEIFLRSIGETSDRDFTLGLLLTGTHLFWVVFAIVIGAPLVEELLFRGFFYGGMARSRWTTLAAILVPNFIWLALHTQYKGPTLLVLFAMGLVLALARHFSHSTLLPLALHIINNAVAIIAALLLLHPTGPSGIDFSRSTTLACMMRADAAEKAGDDYAAIDAYTEALAIDPRNQKALEQRGLLYQSTEDPAAAVADFTSLLGLTAEPERIRYLRADALADSGDSDAARLDLDSVISHDPGAFRAYTLRGDLMSRAGDYDLAIADYQSALRIRPAHLSALRGLASACLEKKDYDLAISQLDQAIRLSPRADLFFKRAYAYGAKGETDRAIADLDEAIRRAPRYAAAYGNRAYAWQQKRDYRKAYRDYQRSLKLFPNDAVTANSFAWLLATCPDPIFRDGPMALRYAERACKLTKWQMPACIDTLAAALAEHGEWDKAVWWQEQCLKRFPKAQITDAQKRLDLYRARKTFTEP